MENIKKSYSTIVDVPEYSKIIEAENVQSQIDAEAEFNRDPALVRQYLFFIGFMFITSLILYLALIASTDARDADEFLKTLEKEKRDVLVPYTQKKIETEIAKKQSS